MSIHPESREIAWWASLPARMLCERDVEEAFEAFERAANEYVLSRLPADQHRFHGKRFFYPTNSVLVVRPEERRELATILGDERAQDTIPMRTALNELKTFMNVLRRVRRLFGTLKEQLQKGEGQFSPKELVDRIEFELGQFGWSKIQKSESE